ncbi:MAG: KTSC domain-containing protein [Spartobacteria bacterium]|nr:KTSC domain-containing protein [Spartobacteria bacterium]
MSKGKAYNQRRENVVMKLMCHILILVVCVTGLCGCATSQGGSADVGGSSSGSGFIRVESDTIFSVMYSENLEDLMIIDTRSNGFEYKGVPKEVYDGFMAADDKDAYYLENIKNKFSESTF